MESRSTVREGEQQRQGASAEGLPQSPARFVTESSSTTATSNRNLRDLHQVPLDQPHTTQSISVSDPMQQNDLLPPHAAASKVQALGQKQQKDLLQSCTPATSVQVPSKNQQNDLLLLSTTTSAGQAGGQSQQNELLQSCAAAQAAKPGSDLHHAAAVDICHGQPSQNSKFPNAEERDRPAPQFPATTVSIRQIVLSTEILAGVRLESQRLQKTAVICKVFGGRPNR